MSDQNLPAEVASEGVRVAVLDRNYAMLYAARSTRGLEAIRKGDPGERGSPSAQGSNPGTVEHPVNYAVLRGLRDENVHHAACLSTKLDATIGLGFKNDTKSDGTPVPHPLDEVCPGTFLWDVMRPVGSDFYSNGFGYIEAVTSDNGEIQGLHHLASDRARVVVEDKIGNFHYLIDGTDLNKASGQLRFCRFGDKERFLKENPGVDPKTVSEVIRFRNMLEMSRWYGYPDWLSAVPAIEIIQLLHQWKGDFFMNRGVPEFILSIVGGQVGTKEWADIVAKLKGHVGSGNAHKTMAINLPHKDVKVQIDKLGMESQNDSEFQTVKDTLSLDVVTAHRVPPLLAGIQIPGKLGASNELTNALLAFHILRCAPVQRLFCDVLMSTIGRRKKDLNPWFRFRSLKDEMFSALAEPGAVALSTVGGMRQGATQAAAEGRDLTSGLKKGDADRLLATIEAAFQVSGWRR